MGISVPVTFDVQSGDGGLEVAIPVVVIQSAVVLRAVTVPRVGVVVSACEAVREYDIELLSVKSDVENTAMGTANATGC